jgi:hypothetical protein
MSEALELQYRQVTAQRSVALAAFPDGVMDYNFSIGGRLGWIPNKSYFRIGITLSGPAGAAPLLKDQVAFADSVCGNLFSNVYCRAGGQDISSITNYAPQASICRDRLHKSHAWLESLGKGAYFLDPDFQDRVNRTAADLPASFESKVQTEKMGSVANPDDYRVQIAAATGVLTGTNCFDFTANLAVGSEILVLGQTYTVESVTDATNVVVTPIPVAAVDTTANGSALKLTRENDGDGRRTIYVMWRPPVALMDHGSPLGSGDYRIQLNPNSYYKSSAVETKLGGRVVPTNYNFEVASCQLYIATAKVDIPVTSTETLYFKESQVQSKTMSNPTGENLLDFTVPPSTTSISVFVQSSDASTNTQMPPSVFKTKDGSDTKLQSIQLTYANTVKPSTRWSSAYTTTTNYLTQRYNDTQQESQQFWNPGGPESFAAWLKRGPLIHYTFNRDKDDRSTHLQVAASYDGLEANTNLFIIAHYTRTVQISTTNGYITNVNSLTT